MMKYMLILTFFIFFAAVYSQNVYEQYRSDKYELFEKFVREVMAGKEPEPIDFIANATELQNRCFGLLRKDGELIDRETFLGDQLDEYASWRYNKEKHKIQNYCSIILTCSMLTLSAHFKHFLPTY